MHHTCLSPVTCPSIFVYSRLSWQASVSVSQSAVPFPRWYVSTVWAPSPYGGLGPCGWHLDQHHRLRTLQYQNSPTGWGRGECGSPAPDVLSSQAVAKTHQHKPFNHNTNHSLPIQQWASDITLGQFQRALKTRLFCHSQLQCRATVFFAHCVQTGLLTYLLSYYYRTSMCISDSLIRGQKSDGSRQLLFSSADKWWERCVCLSACPSNTWIEDKTEEKFVQIFIPYERSFSLVF